MSAGYRTTTTTITDMSWQIQHNTSLTQCKPKHIINIKFFRFEPNTVRRLARITYYTDDAGQQFGYATLYNSLHAQEETGRTIGSRDSRGTTAERARCAIACDVSENFRAIHRLESIAAGHVREANRIALLAKRSTTGEANFSRA